MHRCVAETSNERLCLATDSASPSAFLTSLLGSGSSSTTKNNHDGASVYGDARYPKTATSQPNDLWRFFSNANDDEDEDEDDEDDDAPAAKKPAPANPDDVPAKSEDERTCESCWLIKPLIQFPDDGNICIDCA